MVPAVTTAQGIDVHAHFFPERFFRAIEQDGAASGGQIDRSNPRGPAIVIKGGSTAPLEPRYWDLAKRVASMNRQGVAVQALSLTGPMVYKGFDYFIQGVEVLERTPTGARGNFDRDYADAVVRADPTKYRLVPPSQYRTTD